MCSVEMPEFGTVSQAGMKLAIEYEMRIYQTRRTHPMKIRDTHQQARHSVALDTTSEQVRHLPFLARSRHRKYATDHGAVHFIFSSS
jgi:hypothetical protein